MLVNDHPLVIELFEDACSSSRALRELSLYFSLPAEEIDTNSSVFLFNKPLNFFYRIVFILDKGPCFLKCLLDRIFALK